MPKEIKFNEDARASIKKGIDKLADAVRMTLGPRGRAVIIEKLYQAPMVTFDGVTVAREVELEDKWENVGAELIKQAADKTNDGVGDGTTTATVLAQAMIDEGEKAVKDQGVNVIELADELKRAGEEVITALDSQAVPITELTKIAEVATLSSKDKNIGSLIATVMDKIGKDGVVTIEDSQETGNKYEIVEGMRFEKGYISPYFITNPDRGEAIYDKPLILITDKIVGGIKDILKMVEAVLKTYPGRPLVLIAEDVQADALATLVMNKLKGALPSIAIRTPGFGPHKKDLLQDIATLTGAHIFSDELGVKLEECGDVAFLGSAAKIIVNKDNTTIVGSANDSAVISSYVAGLKNKLSEATSSYDKQKLEERIAKLSGGIAIIRVGGLTEAEQKEVRQRVEDATGATKAAMQEGIVPGGGIALFNVLDIFPPYKYSTQATGIIVRALSAPIKAILENCGKSYDSIKDELIARKDIWIGYNAGPEGGMMNLREAGIIDPLKVTKTAFKNALSVATNYLMVGAAMIEKPEEKKDETNR